MDNPGLIAACVVGDGEAETAPLAAAWHSNKFLNPITDGAVLPILHLNGFKLSNPTLFSRISHEETEMFFKGCGWEPRFVEGDEPQQMHQKMAAALDWAVREIQRIQEYARTSEDAARPRWPMIVFRSPKGWTGPKEVDGKPVEGSWRSHQIPIPVHDGKPGRIQELERWLRSYRPEELFDENGTLIPALRELAPKGERRMGANPHANGGLLLRGSAHPRLPGVPGGGAPARRGRGPGHRRAGELCAGSHHPQPGVPEFPGLWTGRDRLQRPLRRV